MAAVLVCGETAVLSHLSAGELWGIYRPVRRRSNAGGNVEVPDVHVTIPSTAGSGRAQESSSTARPPSVTVTALAETAYR